MADLREWKLVAPWYRWKAQGNNPRATRPTIQKYETSDFVNAFLKDPQHSLKYTSDDLVVVYEPIARLTSGFFKDKLPKFVLPKPDPNAADPSPDTPAESIAKPGTMRKLFLDTHKRHYLVVCELHCDAPGFPNASRDEACEVGFVVRRRRTPMSADQALQAAKILKDLELNLKSKLDGLDVAIKVDLDQKSGISKKQFFKQAVKSPLKQQKAATLQTLATAQAKLKDWSSGVSPILEGWVPSEFEKIGSWQVVDEKPEIITETIFPMYPLIADPRDKSNAGTGRTIYFGVVPVGSADTEDDGTARFDPGSAYEMRCFVRRHKDPCPKKATRNDCPGPLVWSEPTEVYQLAAHFDLIGTSQRPVTMQLPNIPELAAQAASLPPAKIAPFRMASPNAKSNLGFKLDDPKKPGDAKKEEPKPGAIPEICSFAIPLLTIVATFLLKLTLPLIMLVFGLAFLLKLKFCIPPSLEIAVSVQATLAVDLPSIDIDASLSVQLDGEDLVKVKANLEELLNKPIADAQVLAEIKLGQGLSDAATDEQLALKFHENIKTDLLAKIGADPGGKIEALLDNYSPEALVKYEAEMGTPHNPDDLSLTASLQFEPRVSVEVSLG